MHPVGHRNPELSSQRLLWCSQEPPVTELPPPWMLTFRGCHSKGCSSVSVLRNKITSPEHGVPAKHKADASSNIKWSLYEKSFTVCSWHRKARLIPRRCQGMSNSTAATVFSKVLFSQEIRLFWHTAVFPPARSISDFSIFVSPFRTTKKS